MTTLSCNTSNVPPAWKILKFYNNARILGQNSFQMCVRVCVCQGGKKYFTLWEPRFLGQYFARDRVINGTAGAL